MREHVSNTSAGPLWRWELSAESGSPLNESFTVPERQKATRIDSVHRKQLESQEVANENDVSITKDVGHNLSRHFLGSSKFPLQTLCRIRVTH